LRREPHRALIARLIFVPELTPQFLNVLIVIVMANKKSQSKSASTNHNQNNLSAIHRAVYQRVNGMSAREGFKTLVASGIYTTKGNLTKSYGG
jgi:hypothetical protein